MKRVFLRSSCIALILMLGTIFCWSGNAVAEEDGENSETLKAATSIGITPVSKILKLDPDYQYEDSFTVTNSSDTTMEFEVYAAPYSYVFSEDDDEYHLGFSNETAYNQIVRWITFKDVNGDFVKNPIYKVAPGEKIDVIYRVTTPSSIPNGGQYAVLFAHTLSATVLSNGIKTEASPGLVLYGRSNGETVVAAEITDSQIRQFLGENKEAKNIINAFAKVKNTGNVDFMAYGKLQIKGIFGNLYYETPDGQGMLSVIPETELAISDRWDGTPYFGIFRVTWTINAAEEINTITKIILLMPAPIVVFLILLLTIIAIWIILMLRKRKERRSRYMV